MHPRWRTFGRRTATACAVGAVVSLSACRSAGPRRPADPLDQLHDLLTLVEQKYVREVPPEQLVRTGRDAILASLDPYSSYVDAATLTELKAALAGRFGGVGMRLDGTPLERSRQGELPSEGTVAGAIQVPPEGLPVLFLADHPITGGYPVIGVVVDHQLDMAAQVPIGGSIRFRRVPEQASAKPRSQEPTSSEQNSQEQTSEEKVSNCCARS